MAVPKRTRRGATGAAPSQESLSDAPPANKRPRVHNKPAPLPVVSEAQQPERRNERAGWTLCVGEGDAGQLGLGPDLMDCQRLKQVVKPADVVDVCAGAMHSLSLTDDGKVYSFGCNDENALGRPTDVEDSDTRPMLVVGLEADVVQIAAGDAFSAALTRDGHVYAWGTYRDSSGPIGLVAAGRQEPTPVRLQLPSAAVRIAAGSNHVAVLTAVGHVYTCGNGEQGQLGRVPEMFAERGGRRGLEYLLEPRRVMLGGRDKRRVFDRVWAGAFCTVVRCSATSQLYCFGLNNYSQLALEPLIAWQPVLAKRFIGIKVEEFAGAMHHSVCRDSEGRLYTLGRKEDGRLGVPGLTADLDVPTAVPSLQHLQFRSVSAAGYISMAVSTTGDLYCWGMGTTGQLGMGDDQDRIEPELVKGKALEGKEVILASAGGTHTMVVAVNRLSNGH